MDSEYIDAAIELGEGLKLDGIIASDLQRTLQTALSVSIGSGAPILKTTTILHTWNTGDLTGKPVEEVDPLLEKMAVEEPDKVLKGGESFNAFKYRFLIGLISILNEFPGKLLALATHGRNLALLRAWEEMNYNDELEVASDNLGYEEFEPGTATLFTVESGLLI
mgnify:FL=1